MVKFDTLSENVFKVLFRAENVDTHLLGGVL